MAPRSHRRRPTSLEASLRSPLGSLGNCIVMSATAIAESILDVHGMFGIVDPVLFTEVQDCRLPGIPSSLDMLHH